MALSWASWVDAFKVDLEAHATFANTSVTTFPPPGDLRTSEGFTMLRIEGGHDWHTMGPNYADGFDVRCRIWVREPDTDATAEFGKASRDRAQTILDATLDVIEASTSTIYTHCKSAIMSRWEWTPEAWEDGAWVSNVELTVSVLSLP